MRAVVRLLGGLALIAAGASGLIAMNVWTVPLIGSARVRPEKTNPILVTSSSPVVSSTPSLTEAVTAGSAAVRVAIDAGGLDAALDSSGSQTDAATSRSADGTTFSAIVYEPRSKALTKELITKIGPIAKYMRNNYAMMVTLTGHGDTGMSPAEYVHMGRLRAGGVLRTLVDYGVSGTRIGISLPTIEGNRVVTKGVAPGTVEVRIEPRFARPVKGEGNGP